MTDTKLYCLVTDNHNATEPAHKQGCRSGLKTKFLYLKIKNLQSPIF